MAKPGPRPKPTANLKLHGTFRKDRRFEDEPVPDGGMPERPTFLTGPAKKEWGRLALLLYEKGVLTTWDLTTFAQYCWHWGEWVSLGRAIKKAKGDKKDLRTRYTATTSKGGECLDVLVQAQFKALAACRSLATEFGLTPSSRTRIKIGEKKEENPFAKLAKQQRPAGRSISMQGKGKGRDCACSEVQDDA